MSPSATQADFNRTVKAARDLDALLNRRFLNGLENLAAVRERKLEMEQVHCGTVTWWQADSRSS